MSMLKKIFAAAADDAVDLLKHDHREVQKAFSDFEELSKSNNAGKKSLADHIADELLKHMTVEEEIFYPAVKDYVEDAEDIINESIIEHAAAKGLIKQIKDMRGDEEFFDAEVKVLAEQIDHHVEEEEKEMFPKVRRSSLDLDALGRKMAARKAEL
jgi:iron-sulfur cluster repair protein YtfE (RIC family)